MTTFKTSGVLVAGVLVAGLALSACQDAPTSTQPLASVHDHQVAAAKSPLGGGGGGTLLKQVHAAAARFHATKQAEMAGYLEDAMCVAAPGLGGMGHHWVKPTLVDPVFDPLNPEVVLYAPDRNGKMKLVAVEYIVIDVGQPRPSFGGHLFDIGGTPVPVPHWSLHVWLWKENPNGMFVPFNPTVSCP